MMRYFFIYLLFMHISTKKALHMYQQNRYRNDRYFTWLHEACHKEIPEISMTYLMLSLIYVCFLIPLRHFQSVYFLLLIILSYILYKLERKKQYRKKLVLTSRIFRLWGCMLLMESCLILLIIMYFSLALWLLITPLLYAIPWGLIMLCGFIMQPIEDLIQECYLRNAEKKLSSMKDLLIVGITGSYGKTSVKNILFYLLQEDKVVYMTPKSYNNKMGITRSIREHMNGREEVFLCEMGADHAQEISDLMEFVQPQYGIVTAVGLQHLQTFHSQEAILHEKMQMIEKLPEDGCGFLNIDNALIRHYSMQNSCQIIWFGNDPKADYRYTQINYEKTYTTFTILHHKKAHAFMTSILGEHQIANITCAVAIAHHMGISWDKLQHACIHLPQIKHRLERIETKRYTILDDAYNANPEGVKYALAVLRKMPGRHYIITPGMIDLGSLQDKENYNFGKQIAKSADEVILVGSLQTKMIVSALNDLHYDMQHVYIAADINEAFEIVAKNAKQEDTVLVENDLPDAFNH